MINWFLARLPDNSALKNIIKQTALCKLDPDTQKNKSNFFYLVPYTKVLKIYLYLNMRSQIIKLTERVYHHVLKIWQCIFHMTPKVQVKLDCCGIYW